MTAHTARDDRGPAAYKPGQYDHGEGRMPEEVRTAECHTFATGESGFMSPTRGPTMSTDGPACNARCPDCDRTAEDHVAALCRLAALRPHRYDCDCAPCVELRTNLAAITEAEWEAWRSARDIVL